jgi:tetratricopeptide (TPR) repeat protein
MLRFLALILCALPSLAQPAAYAKGFDHFYNLEYDEAIREFSRAAQEQADLPGPRNYLAVTILYREMYRSGALESQLVTGSNPFLRRPKMNPSDADQKLFFDSVNKVIELTQARITKDPKDAQALYAQGVAYALRANWNFLVKKAWMDSLRDATTARKLHNKVSELDPEFVDARLVQGVHDYVVGSLPWTYKMIGFLVGFRGDRDKGIRTLETVAEKGKFNNVDAKVLLAAIYRREKMPDKAVPMLQQMSQRFQRNYLLRLELVQMYSDLGKKDEALAVLDQLEQSKRANRPGYSKLAAEKIYFSRGNLLFWYRDLDRALENLRRVTPKARDLDLNTASIAWMRTGQIHDMKGQRNEAMSAYREAIAIAPDSDAGKESRRYLSSPYQRRS